MKQNVVILWLILIYVADCKIHKLPLYIGRGYDLLRGNPLASRIDPGITQQIFNFTYSQEKTTEDNRFLIPDSVTSLPTSCSFNSKVNTYRGTQSYQNYLKTKAVVSGQYQGKIIDTSFSASYGFREISRSAIEKNETVTQAIAECEAYHLKMSKQLYGRLLPKFVQSVTDFYKNGSWIEFIQYWGTHFLDTVTLGSRTILQTTYTYESAAKLNSIGIDLELAARAKFAAFYGDTSFDYSKYSEAISYSEAYSTNITEIFMGGLAPKDGNTTAWAQAAAVIPMPIGQNLNLLSDLFSRINSADFDAQKAEKDFKSALDVYCAGMDCRTAVADSPRPIAPVFSEMRTRSYGADGGSPFNWRASNPVTMALSKIITKHTSGGSVRRLQLVLSDGVKAEYSPARGGDGGFEQIWNIPKGEYVTQVELAYSHQLDSLIFITNNGTRSYQEVSNGPSRELVTIPDGYQIVGFFGKSNQVIVSIGFILAKVIYPANTIAPVPAQQHTLIRRHLLIY